MPKPKAVKDKYDELYAYALGKGNTEKSAALYAEAHRYDEDIELDGEAPEDAS